MISMISVLVLHTKGRAASLINIEVPRNDHGDEEFDLGALVSNASVAQSRSLLFDM